MEGGRRVIMRLVLRAMLLSGLTFVLVGIGPPAAAEPAPTELELRLEEPTRPQVPYYLTAKLTTADGSVVSGQPVTFYRQVDLAGDRLALIGQAETDAAGIAKQVFDPSVRVTEVVARFGGDEALAASESTQTFTVPVSALADRVADHEVHSLLLPARVLMPRLIAGLVVAIWVGLIGLALVTVRSIRREGVAAGS